MNRTNIFRSITAAAAIAALTSSCGALIDKAAEKAVEEGVERAVEADTGEDVEIDFSDGELTIESDEGDITFSADENGIEIDGTDADGNDFSLEADEDGIQGETGTGESIDIDSDGTFTATDEDGDVFTGDVNEDDGTITIEGDDGETVFRTLEGIPDEWPSDIPQPDGLTEVNGTYIAESGSSSIVITGKVAGDAESAYDDYTSELIDAGFTEDSKFTQGGTASGQYTKGDRNVSVSVQPEGDSSSMVVAIN